MNQNYDEKPIKNQILPVHITEGFQQIYFLLFTIKGLKHLM